MTPQLVSLLERKGVLVPGCDHVVVLKLDARNIMLVYWRGGDPVGYIMTQASIGRDVARLGAPEAV